jgi:hypothetical protein
LLHFHLTLFIFFFLSCFFSKYCKDLKLCLSHTEIFSKRRKIYSRCVKDLTLLSLEALEALALCWCNGHQKETVIIEPNLVLHPLCRFAMQPTNPLRRFTKTAAADASARIRRWPTAPTRTERSTSEALRRRNATASRCRIDFIFFVTDAPGKISLSVRPYNVCK